MLFKSMWGPAKTDEEYREVLKKRRNFIPVLVILGAVSVVVSVFLMRQGEDLMQSGVEKDFVSGVYMGLGGGILATSIAWFFRIRSTLRDEKKLRMRRLKESDERNIQVALKAHHTAGILLILAGYVIMLVSGFFCMEVFWTVWTLIMLYFALFLVGRFIYDKKM